MRLAFNSELIMSLCTIPPCFTPDKIKIEALIKMKMLEDNDSPT
jgi:hypothetical protein